MMRNGVETKLSDATALVPVATRADWYVRGAQLEIGKAPQRLAYLPVGSARVVEASDLKYVGVVQGLPVFIDRDESVAVLDALPPGGDLNQIVAERADVHKALDGIRVLYVPLHASGCVFQAMEKQQEVRKGN